MIIIIMKYSVAIKFPLFALVIITLKSYDYCAAAKARPQAQGWMRSCSVVVSQKVTESSNPRYRNEQINYLTNKTYLFHPALSRT